MPYSFWLKLPLQTRHELARIFKIPKTGATEVSNNEVVKDGYNLHDIEAAITKEAMQAYLGSVQDNFQYLWEDMVNKIEGKPVTARETFTAATEEEPINTAGDVATTGTESTLVVPEDVLKQIKEHVSPTLPTLEEQKNQKTRRVGRPRKPRA